MSGVSSLVTGHRALRRIVVKEFGTNNNTQVFVMERFNSSSEDGPRYYSLLGLRSGTGYTVCFQTIDVRDLRNRTLGDENDWINMASRMDSGSEEHNTKYQFCEVSVSFIH